MLGPHSQMCWQSRLQPPTRRNGELHAAPHSPQFTEAWTPVGGCFSLTQFGASRNRKGHNAEIADQGHIGKNGGLCTDVFRFFLAVFTSLKNDMPTLSTQCLHVFETCNKNCKRSMFSTIGRHTKNKSRPGSRKQSTFSAQKQWLERAERIWNRKERFWAQ